jgi:hypothetical protein
MDPRIRICTKMSWIRNTGSNRFYLYSVKYGDVFFKPLFILSWLKLNLEHHGFKIMSDEFRILLHPLFFSSDDEGNATTSRRRAPPCWTKWPTTAASKRAKSATKRRRHPDPHPLAYGRRLMARRRHVCRHLPERRYR